MTTTQGRPSRPDATATPGALTPEVAPRTGPFVVATDGTDASASVLTMARLLAEAPDVHVLSVVEPAPVMMPPAEVPLILAETDQIRATVLEERLRQQLHDVFGTTPPKLTVVVGSPVETISRLVREQRARMVICGLRHHGRLERALLHRETPLGVAGHARAPVLVVPPGMTALPRTILIAADAGAASVNAARRARPLLARATKVYVLHVSGGGAEPEENEAGAREELRASADHAFDRIVAALDLPASVSVERRNVPGHPVDELLDFAEFARVDLIVAGYHKRLPLTRLVGPRSVAERVFRGTTCAMLLVPEVAGAELPFHVDAEHEAIADRMAWPLQVTAFTYRNAGRPVQLEIDALDTGTQAQVGGYRFLGADMKTPTEPLRIEFGARHTGALELVHTVPHPESVEIQRGSDGRDLALRVAHDGGYSLLTFSDTEGAASLPK